MDIMGKHLQKISDATPAGRYAIVLIDCANWHSSKLMSRFNNLANFAFKNYDDIVNQVSRAWYNFRHQVDHVKSLCKRDRVNLITN